MSRPEHKAPPDVFYNEEEAKKYAVSSRMMEIQTKMSNRAIELLCLPQGRVCHLLDIGCGSGLSGEALSELGHSWVGVDIAPSMLGVARKRGVEGDLLYLDIGDGLPFKPGSFDGAISVSVLQWLCNADKKSHDPRKRLRTFFQSLYSCLARGSRAVFQFYPESGHQMDMITNAAMRCGFSGGLVVDYPNSAKAKKIFLCLFAGEAGAKYELPAAKDDMGGEEDDEEMSDGDGDGTEKKKEKKEKKQKPFVMAGAGAGAGSVVVGSDGQPRQTIMFSHGVDTEAKKKKRSKSKKGSKKGSARPTVKTKDWVLAKKERQRKQGKKTAGDSKFTARPRNPKF